MLLLCRGSNPLARRACFGQDPETIRKRISSGWRGVPLKEDPAWKDWSWFPHGGEKDFELTKVLDVLEPLRSDAMIYAGLSPSGREAAWSFQCRSVFDGEPIRRVTVRTKIRFPDQVYAEYIGDETSAFFFGHVHKRRNRRAKGGSNSVLQPGRPAHSGHEQTKTNFRHAFLPRKTKMLPRNWPEQKLPWIY